ncbi:MAG: FAD-binding oxidoreductase, partial [Mangrovimonas sp.]|nr:FAD-binding oxidoreductase [Mangrovimonas sp.]
NFDELSEEPRQEPSTFTIFKATTLSEVKSLEFPFSEDIEDYFTLKLKSKELVINQFNGEILSEIQQPTTTVFYNLSLTLHTGKGTIVWAIILAIASVNILFFVYSGFSMTFKRTKTKLKNKYNEATAEIVIL